MAGAPWEEYQTVEEPKPWEAYQTPSEDAEIEPVEVVAKKSKDFGIPDAPKETFGQQAKGLARSIIGGATFNLFDELEAALRSGSISGEDYIKARDQIRAQQSAYEAKHPIASGMAGVGGALLTAAPALLIPGAGEAAFAARLAGPLARITRAATVGASEGALAGFGGSKDKFSMEGVGETAKGALAGAVLGPVAAGAPALVRKGVGALRQVTGSVPGAEATQKALEITVAAMRRQGKTPAEIEIELARMRREGTPATVGEVGAPGIADEVMRTPQGAAMAAQTAAAKAETGTRVGEQITNRVTKGADYDVSRENIVENMRKNAAPLYAKAFEHGEVDDPFIKNILDMPVMRTFWSDAMAAAERDASVIAAKTGQPPVNPLQDYLVPTGRMSKVLGPDGNPFEIVEYQPSGDKIPTVEVLDWLKRGMDEAVDRGFRTGGMGAKGAGDYRQIRDALTGRLDDLVPDYKAARASFKGDAEIRDAFDRGMSENVTRGEKAFESMRPAEVAKWATDATQAERDAAFSGYGNFLLKKLTTATNPAVFVGDANRMGRMRALSDNPAEMDALEAALKREAELFAQRSKSLTGVTQAVKKAAQDDINTALDAGNVDVISAALRSGKVGYFAGLALKVLTGKNYPPEVLTELTRVLKSGTPDEVARVAAELAQTESKMVVREVGRTRLRDAAAVAAGKVGAGREEPGLDVEGIPSYEAAPDQETPDEGVGYTPASYTPGKGASLGERNNNPGNLEDGAFAKNQPGYAGAAGRFAVFDSPEAGAAAQEALLANNYLLKGFNTPNKIVERYSPRNDPGNTPASMTNYKKYIADQLGIGVNDPIPTNMVAELARAMREFETGNRA